MGLIARILLSVALPVMLSGCAGTSAFTTTQSVTPVPSQPTGFASWTDEVPDYRFIPGDKVRVQFLLTPELGEDTVVAPDGQIGLRAAGQVMAGGRTARELQDGIAEASKRNLVNPIVTASLLESPGARIFVGGSVARPGAFAIDGRRGPFEAIVLAGGFDPEARMDEVVLIRRNPQNRPMLRTVDLRGFVSLGNDSGDLPLVPGDIIFVPRNRISEIDQWIDQFINKFLPFQRTFNYTVNRTATAGAVF